MNAQHSAERSAPHCGGRLLQCALRGWSLQQVGPSISAACADATHYDRAMRALRGPGTPYLTIVLALLACTSLTQLRAGSASDGPHAVDGQHDFDWDIGTWKIHQRRLLHPLTGSTDWVESQGTDVVRKIWDGANSGEISADGPAGHLELYTLRLYNTATREWSIYFTNSSSGALSPPAVGKFAKGRGEFYDQETYNGRTILLRFSVSDITADSCRFEQAFSADGGRTWETNFIVTETLVRN
jgi:hypothetical protein